MNYKNKGWACWWSFKVSGLKAGAVWKLKLQGSGFAAPRRASVSPDGKMVAAAGSDGKIRLFNSTDGKATSTFVPVKLEGEGVAVSTVKEPQTEAAVPAKETLPKGATVSALTIEPTELVLNSPIAYAQVLVSAKLATGEFDALTLVHNETSTGTMSPLEDIAALKKKYSNLMFIVDSVTSMTGVKI